VGNQQFTIGNFLVALVYIAILYTLVRPGSNATAVISAVTSGLGNLVSAATGGGSFSSSSATASPAISGAPPQASAGTQVV